MAVPPLNSDPARRPRAAAVIFDLDGTLTMPYFDFDAIRREIGLPTEPRTPILEAMELMSPTERDRCHAILLKHETKAAHESELWEDTLEVLGTLRRAHLPLGLLTRNSRRSVDLVLAKHGLAFDCIHTREDGPIKPSPAPVLSICRHLAVKPEVTWMIGDYLFDIQSGHAAGATTVLMAGNGQVPDFADQADHVIHRLGELPPLLSIGR
jgi:HAD superfamily hydrolase (TIGR01549 family)